MNKILSQALKKAVSEYSPQVKEVGKENRSGLLPFGTFLTSGLYSETAFFRACDKILFII